MSQDNTFEYSVWVKRGIMLVRRDGLSFDDPESVPSLYIKKFGSLDGFPFDEFYGENNTVEKQLAMAKSIDTDLLKAELARRFREEV